MVATDRRFPVELPPLQQRQYCPPLPLPPAPAAAATLIPLGRDLSARKPGSSTTAAAAAAATLTVTRPVLRWSKYSLASIQS